MLTLTSTSSLSAGTSGSLSLANSAVNVGTATIPVFVGAANSAVAGIYLTSAGFFGTFLLQRHNSGFGASGFGGLQTVWEANETAFEFGGPGPVANITAADVVAITLLNASSGNITLSVVQ